MIPGGPAPVAAALAQADPGLGLGLGADPMAVPPTAGSDPLASVGLALLAYALVQLLSRVVDRLPTGRTGEPQAGGSAAPAAPYGPDDRRRLERVHDLVVADHARIERLEEALREVHEQTRWLHEQRLLTREPGGPFHCRAAGLADDLAVNRRLVGQTLDAVRAVEGQHAVVLRRLRGLWRRTVRRGDRN